MVEGYSYSSVGKGLNLAVTPDQMRSSSQAVFELTILVEKGGGQLDRRHCRWVKVAIV